MCNKLNIIIIFTFLSFKLSAENIIDTFIISGNVKVLVGNEIFIPIEKTIIEIRQTNKINEIDFIGNFKVDRLKIGNYNIRISSFGFEDIDTMIKIDSTSINNLNFLFISKCSINKQTAENDIKLNAPKLLLVGSIAPLIYPNQESFEKKYNIKYYDFGCTPPNYECILQYNRIIFAYLDSRFGKSWRKEVRKDVIGLFKLR